MQLQPIEVSKEVLDALYENPSRAELKFDIENGFQVVKLFQVIKITENKDASI